MQIEYMNIEELIPYENNPRHNDGDAVDKVAASIKEFGFKNPIIIDKDNVIVAGHTRLKAAKQLGIEKVPTIKVDDLTPEQVKAFRLADNKVSEFASWDIELLNDELKDILDIEMSDFGFIEIEDIDIDGFFEDDEREPKEKEEKEIKCPHCGMYFKVE